MGTLRRSKQRTDAFLLARPAGYLSNFKESSKRACSQAINGPATQATEQTACEGANYKTSIILNGRCNGQLRH